MSRNKTKTFVYNFGGSNCEKNVERHAIKIENDVVCELNRFMYLGSVIQNKSEFENDVRNIIKIRWMKRKETSDILCGTSDSI